MTKFVSISVFSEQNLFCPKVEPLCITTSEGIFWVALTYGVIKGFSTHQKDKKFEQVYEFNTIWSKVTEIYYLPKLKRIITIEKKDNEKKCRVYHLLWDKKRFFTRIPVYTLPTEDKIVKHLQVCQDSNSILMCANDNLYLWKCFEESDPVCILKIFTNWDISFLGIQKEFITYGTSKDLKIIKIKLNDENQEIVYIRNESSKDTKSDDFINIKYDTTSSEFVKKDYDIIGDNLIVDHPCFIQRNYVSRCVQLLYKHFGSLQQIISIHFIRNVSQKKQSFEENSGLRCIISTKKKGYVYDVFTAQSLSEFDYSGECLMTSVNSLFLYAITLDGIEVWSVLGTQGGCLLRTYPFIGLTAISSTKSFVALLSKVSSKVKQKEVWHYNVYILTMVNLVEIYEDMLEYANAARNGDVRRTSNIDVYPKLIKESHGLLQSKYYDILADYEKLDSLTPLEKELVQKEHEIFTKLLKKSFSLYGQLEARENGEDAPFLFANSDQTMDEVIPLLNERDLLSYFDMILFDRKKTSICKQDQKVGNFIIDLYKKHSPSLLSKVILDSNLQTYDQLKVIEFFENLKVIKIMDEISLFLLYIDNGKLDQAKKLFEKLDHKNFIDYCISNPKLFNTDLILKKEDFDNLAKTVRKGIPFEYVPSLGFYLLYYFPITLLEILLKIPKFFKPEKAKILLECSHQILLETYLENFTEYHEELTHLYLNDLAFQKKLIVEGLNLDKFKQNFYDKRPKWIKDYDNELIENPFINDETYLKHVERNLQGIIQSNENYQKILNDFKDNFKGKFIIQIICDKDNILNNCKLILDENPLMLISFVKNSIFQIEDWLIIMNLLNEKVKKNEHIEIYENILLYLSKIYEPSKFLTLIPMNGNLDYFYKFLFINFQCWNSKDLLK